MRIPVGLKKREKGRRGGKSAGDAAWWSLIGSQKEGEQRGWVNTDALACRHIKAAKSLKTRGGVCIECVYGQARACVNAHVSALVSTGVSEGFLYVKEIISGRT